MTAEHSHLEEGERKDAGTLREYRTGEIVVYWEPEYCVHSANCIFGLPKVFDVRRRPWVTIDGAPADDIARVISTCPSGALHFRRLDGGAQEAVPTETEVQPEPDGPLYVRGNLKLFGPGGLVREDTRIAFCRCGYSENKPFCDGTHREVGFTAP